MARSEIIERAIVKDAGNGIANRTHYMLDGALGFVRIRAIPAFLVGGLTHAADGCKWAVQNANHLADRNLLRRLDQGISALEPASAGQQARPLQS